MRKYITLFFSVSLLLFACTAGKSNGKVIEHDQMVRLLTDIHILDGSLYNAVSQSPDTLYKYGTARYLTLFKKYHVDSVEFRRSLRYYTTQPIEFQAMYDKILVDLQAKTDSINKKLLKTTNAPNPK